MPRAASLGPDCALLSQAGAATAAAAEALAAQKAAYAQQAAQLEAQRRALQAQEQAAHQAGVERAKVCFPPSLCIGGSEGLNLTL